MYSVKDKHSDIKRRIIDVDGEKLDTETGEVMGEDAAQQLMAELMAELLSDQADGAETALKIIKELEAFNTALDVELERLSAIKASRKSKIERIKDSVRAGMIDTGMQTIDTALGAFKLNKGRESVVVHDFDKLKAERPEFVRVKVTESPDKKALGAAIKGGDFDAFDIASKVRGETTLSIK